MRSAETSIEEHEVENEKIMIEQTEKFLKNLSEPGRTRLTSADYSLYLPQLEKIVGDLESKRTGLTPEEDKQKIEELKNLIKSALSPVTEGHYEERASKEKWSHHGGTLVPMYDVRADAGRTTGQGNVAIGDGTGSLDSWTVIN